MAEPQSDPKSARFRKRRAIVVCIVCRLRKLKCNREIPSSNCVRSKDVACLYYPEGLDALPNPQTSQTQSQPAALPEPPPPEPGPSTSSSSYPVPPFSGGQEHNNFGFAAPPLPPPSEHRPRRPGRPSNLTTRLPSLAAANAAIAPPSRSIPPEAPLQPPGERRKKRKAPQAEEQGESSAAAAAGRRRVGRQFVNVTFSPADEKGDGRVETTTVELAGFTEDIHFQSEQHSPGPGQQQRGFSQSVVHRRRFFGQSHWLNVMNLIQPLFQTLTTYLRASPSPIPSLSRRAKHLAKLIKARQVCDVLVTNYLRTYESIYRLLHIPSFQRAYDAVWGPEHTPDTVFVVQLKLVLAIGAATYDGMFSLRSWATKWVYEAGTWLGMPGNKGGVSLAGLQTSILLLLAKEATGVDEDMVWVGIGSVIRMAMCLGLHRDPTGLAIGPGPGGRESLYDVEMRRRLWNTVLEIAVQASLNSDGPPGIGLEDFNTKMPGNYNDEDLERDTAPKPETTFTQTSLAIALRRILPERLAIAKYLNNFSSKGVYAETLRHDTELRAASKALNQILQTYRSVPNGPSDLDLRMLDLLIRRYFPALHFPFFSSSLTDKSYAFSRKVVVESALRFRRAIFPSPLPSSNQHDPPDDTGDLLSRSAINGETFLSTVPLQSFICILAELQALIRESEDERFGLSGILPSLSVETIRPDLVSFLSEFKEFAWRAIRAGATNVKGYLVGCVGVAAIDAVKRQENKEEVVVRALEEGVRKCVRWLERCVEGGYTDPALEEDGDIDVQEGRWDGDWEYMARWIFGELGEGFVH